MVTRVIRKELGRGVVGNEAAAGAICAEDTVLVKVGVAEAGANAEGGRAIGFKGAWRLAAAYEAQRMG